MTFDSFLSVVFSKSFNIAFDLPSVLKTKLRIMVFIRVYAFEDVFVHSHMP